MLINEREELITAGNVHRSSGNLYMVKKKYWVKISSVTGAYPGFCTPGARRDFGAPVCERKARAKILLYGSLKLCSFYIENILKTPSVYFFFSPP